MTRIDKPALVPQSTPVRVVSPAKEAPAEMGPAGGPKPAAVVPAELKPVDGSSAVAAADTPIDPVVDARAQFPPVKPGAAGGPQPVQPLSEPDTVAPASLPPKLSESYGALSKRLNANPQVNYIDLERQDQNKGLSQFLTQFKDQLDSTPGLREKLAQTPAGKQLLEVLENASKGALSSQDILKLQTFIVSAGEDISHANSPTGIDGAFGPRTHQGLQNAFNKILTQPDETIKQFESNYTAAAKKAQDRITDYENMGGNVPSGGYAPEPAQPGQQGIPGQPGVADPGISNPAPADRRATPLGQDIAGAVNQSRPVMKSYLASHGGYYCYRGVKDVLSRVHPPVNLTGGSAYQAADQLRTRYADRFQEVKLTVPPNQATRDYLKNLPAGAVVVWGHSNNPAKYNAGLQAGNGYAHGHISVALGNGYEFSDRDRPQITGPGDPERYGSLTVFLPKDGAAATGS